jgi:hypothetical protein
MVPDTNRNGIPGSCSRTMASACWPLKPGIVKSLSTTSGAYSASARRRACSVATRACSNGVLRSRRARSISSASASESSTSNTLSLSSVRSMRQSGASLAIIQYMPTWATVSANSAKSTGLTTKLLTPRW